VSKYKFMGTTMPGLVLDFTVGKVYETKRGVFGDSPVNDSGVVENCMFNLDGSGWKEMFQKVEEPKFAVGDKWKTRCGEIVSITKIDGTEDFEGTPQPIECDNGREYSLDGRFASWESKNDLVEKVPTSADDPETWKKGDVIRWEWQDIVVDVELDGPIKADVYSGTVLAQQNSYNARVGKPWTGACIDECKLVRRAEQAKPLNLSTAKKPGILAGAKVGDRFKAADGSVFKLTCDDGCNGRAHDGGQLESWWLENSEHNCWFYEDGKANIGGVPDLVEKIEALAPNFLPIGSYIKFVRNSRSGRYKKGQVGRIADHGPKSMVVHVQSYERGSMFDGFDKDTPVFLPPERPDIYETVQPTKLKDCKWMDLVLPIGLSCSQNLRWYTVQSMPGNGIDTLVCGHPRDEGLNRHGGSVNKNTTPDAEVIVLGRMKTVP